MSGASLETDRRQALALWPVSRETEARLATYVSLLLRWHSRINLISPGTAEQIWTRHIADSLQLLPDAAGARTWIDIGSGAGFPGLVVAIGAIGSGLESILVEPNHKRCAFLREVIRETGAVARVVGGKIEDVAESLPQPDVVSARAVAPLASLLAMAYPLLKTGGRGVFPKGQDVEIELTEAAKCWRFKQELRVSITEPRSRIVTVSNLSPLAPVAGG